MKVTAYVYGGTKPVEIEPDKLVVEEAEGMHDLAVLSLSSDYGREIVRRLNLADTTQRDVGPPVSIEIISSNVLATFYGYVDTTVDTRSLNDRSTEEIYCLSASSIMRNGHPRVWRDKRPFEIASDIVAAYGLGLEMDKLPVPMASFIQSDESDWEALRSLATLNGLSLTVTTTTVKLKDVINETRRARGSRLTPRLRRPGSRSGPGQEVNRFSLVASRTPLGGEMYRYYGVDQLGVSFEVSGGVSSISRNPGVVVKSLGAALREAHRHEAAGRLVTRATLDATGFIGCSAGECVLVDNEQTPEYWYIASSKHTMTPIKDEHKMTLELCRQEGNAPGYIPTNIPQRPRTVLTGKEWRADRQWRIEL